MAHRSWVRVKDPSTKHEFDVPEGDPRIGSTLEAVKADLYPPAQYPRPAKHHAPARSLVKPPASRKTPEPSGDGKPDTKES